MRLSEFVAVCAGGRWTRAELAGTPESVGIAQACVLRGVSLELGDVAHRHFFSMRDGPQRTYLCREHLLVPSEERVRGAADAWDARWVSSSREEGEGAECEHMGIPVVDTRNDGACPTIWCVVSRMSTKFPSYSFAGQR
jgi:hypothetical protein